MPSVAKTNESKLPSGSWLTAYSKTFDKLQSARVLIGISEAYYLPASFALIADYHRTTTRSITSEIHE